MSDKEKGHKCAEWGKAYHVLEEKYENVCKELTKWK